MLARKGRFLLPRKGYLNPLSPKLDFSYLQSLYTYRRSVVQVDYWAFPARSGPFSPQVAYGELTERSTFRFL